MKILDPCAGGDSVHDMSYPIALIESCGALNIETIDIRIDSRAEIKADYLTHCVHDAKRDNNKSTI